MILPLAKKPSAVIAYTALLCTVGLILSYLESFIPFIPLPGVKMGFANIAGMVALYLLGAGCAAAVTLLRAALSALLFGSVSSMWFSLCGALFTIAAMTVLIKLPDKIVSPFGISVAGAALHNVGQTVGAALMFGDTSVFGYLPMLLYASAVTGLVNGMITCAVMRIIKPVN